MKKPKQQKHQNVLEGLEVYQVGGSVRDSIQGLEPSDHDWVVVGATQEMMIARGFKQVGENFPVYLHPKTKEEYALARKEISEGKGHKEFSCIFDPDVTLEEDLKRRDLTVNAVAIDSAGKLIDPYNGIEDIKKKILRVVDPKAFIEDPLRVLRVARFAAKLPNFKIATKTINLMKKISASGGLDSLTPERIWMETEKALKTFRPRRYFDTLKDCDALRTVFPEFQKLVDIPQPEKHHRCDAYEHSMRSLQASICTAKTRVRFAVATHDLGKGETREEILPHHFGHELMSQIAVNELCDRLRIPNHFRDLAVVVAREHMNFHRLKEMTPQKILRLCKKLNVFHEETMTDDFIISCLCDTKMEKDEPEFLDDLKEKTEQAGFLKEAADGLRGIDNKEVIHRSRLNKIKRIKRKLKGDKT